MAITEKLPGMVEAKHSSGMLLKRGRVVEGCLVTTSSRLLGDEGQQLLGVQW